MISVSHDAGNGGLGTGTGTRSPKYAAEFKRKIVGLGANVAVLKGAANGDDAIIIVNSVITRDVSANALLQESWERVYRELQKGH